MLAVDVAPTAVKLVSPSTLQERRVDGRALLHLNARCTSIAPSRTGQGRPVLERHLYVAIGVAATMLAVWAFLLPA